MEQALHRRFLLLPGTVELWRSQGSSDYHWVLYVQDTVLFALLSWVELCMYWDITFEPLAVGCICYWMDYRVSLHELWGPLPLPCLFYRI